jgi:hypothetical protein
MMGAEQCRAKAGDCRLRAEHADDEGYRALYHHMESCWHALAARVEITDDAELQAPVEPQEDGSQNLRTEYVAGGEGFPRRAPGALRF